MGFCEPGELNDFVGRRQHPLARRPAADQHERRQHRRGLHPRVRQRRRGGAPGARRLDVPGRRRRAEPVGVRSRLRAGQRRAVRAVVTWARCPTTGRCRSSRRSTRPGSRPARWRSSAARSAPRCSTRPEEICHACGAMTFDTVTLAPRGTVASYTVVHYAAQPALADAVPYTVVLVSLDDAPHLRVVGNLDGDDVHIGMPSCRTGTSAPPTTAPRSCSRSGAPPDLPECFRRPGCASGRRSSRT